LQFKTRGTPANHDVPQDVDLSDQTDAEEDGSGTNAHQRNTGTKSRTYSSVPHQCQNIESMLNNSLQTYPLVQTRLHTLKAEERAEIMQIALEHLLMAAPPRIAFFWHWLIDALEDETLNYSDFARKINSNRNNVTRTILPQAIRWYAYAVEKTLLIYLAVTTPSE